jgi:hypothetical protein
MKKATLLIASLGFTFFSNAQQNSSVLNFNPSESPRFTSPNSEFANSTFNVNRAPGDVLFSEDFSAGLGAWTTSGSQGSEWLIDMDGPNGGYSDPVYDMIESPSVGNGFVIFDADFYNANDDNPDLYGNLISPVIDLSGVPGATLKFYQKYRSCCAFAWYPKVHVSTDNFTNFEEFDVTVHGINTNDASPTIEMSLNLSQFLASSSDPSNFQFRFVFEDASNYYWEIDDIVIEETNEYDISMETLWLDDINFTFEHTDIPQNLAGALTVQAHLKNAGHAIPSTTQIVVSVLNDQGAVVATETGGTLSNNFAQIDDTITFTTGIDLSSLAVGTYTVSTELSLSETDANDANDTLSRQLNITNFYLGQRVYEKPQVTKGLGKYYSSETNSSEPLLMGNVMYVPNDIELHGLEVTLGNTTRYPLTVGAEVEVRLYEMDYTQANFSDYHIDLGEYRFFTITSDMVPAQDGFKDVLFNFHESTSSAYSIQLTGGKYYLLAIYHSGGLNNHFAYSTNSTDDDYSSHYTTSDGSAGNPWYVVARQVHTRMNFDQSLSIDEKSTGNELKCTLYPNPTNASSTIAFEMKEAGDVRIELLDLTGKVIQVVQDEYEQEGPFKTEVKLSELTSGMYQVRITTPSSVVTKTVTKK